MLDVVVLVSGGGTNLQAIIDAVESGSITNTRITGVISNNKNAYALERAKKHGVRNQCISPKDFASRDEFNERFIEVIDEWKPDLIVLAGFLVVIPPAMIERYRNRIVNIHPSLIPSFCGTGFYGLKVHEAALERGVKVVGATVHFVDGPDHPAESRGSRSRGYAGDPAEARDGTGGMEDPAAGDRSDRERESIRL